MNLNNINLNTTIIIKYYFLNICNAASDLPGNVLFKLYSLRKC